MVVHGCFHDCFHACCNVCYCPMSDVYSVLSRTLLRNSHTPVSCTLYVSSRIFLTIYNVLFESHIAEPCTFLGIHQQGLSVVDHDAKGQQYLCPAHNRRLDCIREAVNQHIHCSFDFPQLDRIFHCHILF